MSDDASSMLISQAYVQGRFTRADEAVVPLLDRGLLFGDAVYEVVRFVGGQGFALDQHVSRLMCSLDAVGIAVSQQVRQLPQISEQLLDRAGTGDATVYWQVTRGVMNKRAHDWDDAIEPTVMALADPVCPLDQQRPIKQGTALLLADRRWADPWVKTTMLLPNTLARHQAHADGHIEALLQRDGAIVEGTSTNVMAVNQQGELVTPPLSGDILPGVTRHLLLDQAKARRMTVREQPLNVGQMSQWRELMICGTATLVAAITSVHSHGQGSTSREGGDEPEHRRQRDDGPEHGDGLRDGQIIGDGEVGPVTRELYRALLGMMLGG